MKNIIFDVGDVLLEYRWKDMLVEDYGMTEERAVQIGKSMFDDPLWSGLDLGNPLEDHISILYRLFRRRSPPCHVA